MGINGHTILCEDYVGFETAKLLKEKGFDIPCMGRYSVRSKEFHLDCTRLCSNSGLFECAAPSQAMTMKWLREVHQYIIEIHYGDVGSPKEPKIQWWWELENKQGEFLDGNITNGNTTYEEACEAAIKYCLENLI